MKTHSVLRRVGLAAGACCLLCGVSTALAAPPADELAEGRRLLADVKDHVFSFDDEAFYWFCKHVRRSDAPGDRALGEDEAPTPWRFLLERPSDYRGQLVVIEGTLLRKTSFEVPNRPGVGRLHQCELTSRGTRAVCTVILTDEPQGVPIHARVRGQAYFIKVRSFRTRHSGEGTGPLLVGRGIIAVSGGGSRTVGFGPALEDAAPWLAGATAVLAIAWYILRRRLRVEPVVVGQRPSNAEMQTESEADFDWLLGEGDEGESR
jgi:hypothetical protein